MKKLTGTLTLTCLLAVAVPAWAQTPDAACPDLPWLIKYGQHLIQQRDKLEEEVVKLVVEVERLRASLPKPQPKQETPK